MDLIKITIILAVIVIIVLRDKPLYVSISGGIVATLIFYQIPFNDYPSLTLKALFGKDTVNVVLSFYTITFLQRMLEKRGRLILAEKAVSNIFNSRRVNAMVVPFIIGLLPSAGAVLIAYPIVVAAAGDYLSKDETTFVTSYFRHISEAFVPTYASIILALSLANMSMTGFVLLMLIPVFMLFAIGYLFYVRKIPKGGEYLERVDYNQDPQIEKEVDFKQEWINLAKGMWAILMAVVIILVFQWPVYYVVVGIIVINFLVDKFTLKEIAPFFISAIEIRLILTTVIAMGFKEVLMYTGLIERLPSYFVKLPVPPKLIYAVLFFLGTILAGSQAIIAIMIPLIFSSLPNAGLAYFVLLMSISYIAMQVSPAHVCLGIVTENAGTTFNGLIRKTLPVMVVFTILMIGYYFVLTILGF